MMREPRARHGDALGQNCHFQFPEGLSHLLLYLRTRNKLINLSGGLGLQRHDLRCLNHLLISLCWCFGIWSYTVISYQFESDLRVPCWLPCHPSRDPYVLGVMSMLPFGFLSHRSA